MWTRVLLALRAPRTDGALREAFFRRYAGRTLIAHAGLPLAWLDELLRLGGGAAHFRIDVRRAPGGRPTAVEWVVHTQVVPLQLPLPLLMQVRPDVIRIRHLQRPGGLCGPADIGWMLEEMHARAHARLLVEGGGFRREWGIPPDDNALQTPYGMI